MHGREDNPRVLVHGNEQHLPASTVIRMSMNDRFGASKGPRELQPADLPTRVDPSAAARSNWTAPRCLIVGLVQSLEGGRNRRSLMTHVRSSLVTGSTAYLNRSLAALVIMNCRRIQLFSKPPCQNLKLIGWKSIKAAYETLLLSQIRETPNYYKGNAAISASAPMIAGAAIPSPLSASTSVRA